MQQQFTVSPFWDSRSRLKGTDLHPISLFASRGKTQFRVSLKLYASKQDYEKAISGKGGSDEIKELRKKISDCITKAEKILEKIPNPSLKQFQRLFKSETNVFSNDKTDLSFFFQQKIDDLKAEDRLSTADNYRLALVSFTKYSKMLTFESIDEKFLKGYKTWMLNEGRSTATAQIYLRYLRHIFNKAIADGFISEKLYPFENFSIGTTKKSKNALYAEHITALFHYEPKGVREARAKAYFFFTYLSSGMNYKDMCYLKGKNINGNYIEFVREKTKRTTLVQKIIKVYLHPEAKKIIDEWGNKSYGLNDYIFPVLNGCKTIVEKEKKRNRIRGVCNRMLNRIGRKLGFDTRLNLGIARHSFATSLKVKGTPITHISDALGHTTTNTTMHYLSELPDENIKEMSEGLLNIA